MINLFLVVFVVHLVEAENVFVPFDMLSKCAVDATLMDQNVVIYDSVRQLCLLNTANTAVKTLQGQKSFTRSFGDKILTIKVTEGYGQKAITVQTVQTVQGQKSFTRSFDNKILLFKVTEGYGQKAITFFQNTAQYNDSFFDWRNDGDVMWYKSGLLKDVSRFKFMIVEMTDAKSAVQAWLKFQVSDSDTAESWFKSSSLVDSYPWSVASIKSTTFTTFGIAGKLSDFYRTFYIGIWGTGCYNDGGIITVYEEPDTCGYVTGNFLGYRVFGSFPPPKMAFFNTTTTVKNTNSLVFVRHLRIIGVLKDIYAIYY